MEKLAERNLYNDVRFIVDTIKDAETRYLWGPKRVMNKDSYDIVTNADKKIESFIKKMIKKHYPNDIIIGEEFSPDTEMGDTVCWTIDPIDGTVNYSRNIPAYGMQIALIIQKEIKVSVIYLPEVDILYWAIKGIGAFSSFDDLTEDRVRVNKNAKLNCAIISMGDFSHKDINLKEREIKAMSYLSEKVSKIRMWGAACIDFASVAGKMSDGYMVFTKNLWDICPGLLICEEAGAIITNSDGMPYSFGDECILVAANKEIHAQMLASVN